jgi:NAD(P)-dependent dehydrogenase (short-subunit alcohol dehydrogenase family)
MNSYLVVGGSSGIGKAIVNQLVYEGHRVFATYFSHRFESGNDMLSTHYLDVLQDELEMDFLPEQLDGLVYCPGTINLKPFARIKPQTFRDDYEIQFLGAVKTIQAAIPRLKKPEQSSIVLFSTVAVQTGFNFHSIVSSSKGAIEGLTRSLAAEFAPKIRVNCIAPSITETKLAAGLLNTDEKKEASAGRHPLKRIGHPADIGQMAAFLLTAKSGWVTGQVFHVDGGISTLKV